MVELDNNLFIFDYFKDNCKKNRYRDCGQLKPEDMPKDKNVYIFVSHGHYDHYDKEIRLFLLAYPQSAEILLSVYEVKDDFQKNQKREFKSAMIEFYDIIGNDTEFLTFPRYLNTKTQTTKAGFLRQSRFPYRQAPKSYSECLLSAKTLYPSPLSQKYIYHQRQNRLFRHTLPYIRLLVARQKNSLASSLCFGLNIKRRIDLYFRDKFYPAFLIVFYLHTLLRLSLSGLLFANSIDTNKGYFG